MITDQLVNSHEDMHKVADNILRDAGMAIEDSGGKVTFAGKEPIKKTVIKAGASAGCVLAANAVADDPILYMQGASQPVWMTDSLGKPLA